MVGIIAQFCRLALAYCIRLAVLSFKACCEPLHAAATMSPTPVLAEQQENATYRDACTCGNTTDTQKTASMMFRGYGTISKPIATKI